MEVEETESAGVTTISITGPVEISGQPPKPSCETCRFYAANLTGYPEETGRFGTCHVNAPLHSYNYTPQRFWPEVAKADWCGEHEGATA